jgi:glycosyltransferase involved in cell wall biosynthesis
MRIKVFGWEHPVLSQVARIREGFISLGHELVDNNPDLLYSNNDRFCDVIDFYQKQENEPFLILNILDLQTDNPAYPLEEIKFHLSLANQITCISETTKKQIKKHLGFDNVKVIYNPAKPTYSLGEANQKTFPFLYVGRANSRNKRFHLIKETLELACWPYNYLRVCGTENPIYCQYEGIVDDNTLNNLYNAAGIVLLTSVTEGIGLSAIESLQTFTPVIGCSDCEAMVEFLPECMICAPNPLQIRNKIFEIKENYDYYRQVAFEKGIIYKEQFSAESVCKRIIDLFENRPKLEG